MSFLDTRLAVIKHELGHWLVARHVGFNVDRIEVRVMLQTEKGGAKQYTQAGSSKVYPAPVITDTADLKAYLEKRYQVLYAGIAAQIHGEELTPVETGQRMERYAASDLKVIYELAPLLRGMIYGEEVSHDETQAQYQEMLSPIWERTQILIEDLYPQIVWMAKKLEVHVTRHDANYPFPLDLLEHLANEYKNLPT